MQTKGSHGMNTHTIVLSEADYRLWLATHELLDACEYALRETVRPGSDPLIKTLKAAINKAKQA